MCVARAVTPTTSEHDESATATMARATGDPEADSVEVAHMRPIPRLASTRRDYRRASRVVHMNPIARLCLRREFDSMETAVDPVVEERRQRQRQHAKRSYYKRAKAMAALKAERELLEQQYRQALVDADAAKSPTATDSAISHLRLQETGAQSVSELAERFMELSVARDELRRENQGLKNAVARYFTMQRKVLQSIEDLDNESDLQVHQLITNDRELLSPSTLAQHLERVTLTKPLTSAECAELNRKACDEMQALRGSCNSNGSGVSEGTSLCGWQEYRNSSSGRVRFSIEKLFPAHSATELSSKTWDIASSATQFQELYSANIGIQIDVLQRVDADNVLIYRTTQLPNSTRASKALLLISRINCSQGTGVLVRSVERTRVQPVDPSGVWFDDEIPGSWTDTFLWSLFKEVGERREQCTVEIGGVVATTMATEFWMLEALLMSLRWETRVIGPVFTAV